MSDWLIRLSHSLADQAGAWFVGLILALLGAFSGRIVEKMKFALNRADLRTKYYEQMATEISSLLFAVERLMTVYYAKSRWANEATKETVVILYGNVTTSLFSNEYVYLSWLGRYWGKRKSDTFKLTMRKVRDVDAACLRLNEHPHDKALLAQLESAFHDLEQAAHTLLEEAE